MPTFIKCLGAKTENGEFRMLLLGSDQKSYEFNITPHCLTYLLAGAINLGPTIETAQSNEGEAPEIKMGFGVSIVDLLPGFLLESGPLKFVLRLTVDDAREIRDGISQVLQTLGKQGPSH